MEKQQIVISVEGGCLAGIYASDPDNLDVLVLDWDNIVENHTRAAIDTLEELFDQGGTYLHDVVESSLWARTGNIDKVAKFLLEGR